MININDWVQLFKASFIKPLHIYCSLKSDLISNIASVNVNVLAVN